jgi:predicted MFS family arabinose efflux permease
MWWVYGAVFALLIPSLGFGWYPAMIALFVALAVLENFWRPVLISRFNAHSTPDMTATVLSIESQSKSVATIVLAPLLGWTVDLVGGFWTIGVVGTVIAAAIILTGLSLNVQEKQHEPRELSERDS